MPRILLDQNLPRGLRRILSEHSVETAFRMGWSRLENGDLLKAAETAGFEIFIAADQNIRYQQNLAGRRLALVILPTNFWPAVQANAEAVMAAVRAAGPGGYRRAVFDRPAPRPGPT